MECFQPTPPPQRREAVLKKLLIKICLREEVERFRLDPTCWRDGGANPLLHRTLVAIRSCPLLRDAAIGDDLFQQLLSTLPSLAAQMKAIDGKDLLVTLANDLGNMWAMVLLAEHEIHNQQGPDMELLDDMQPEDHDGDATYMAGARAIREQSMRSFVMAMLDIGGRNGSDDVADGASRSKSSRDEFSQIYHDTIHAPTLEDIPHESVKTAIVHAFDAMDYMITHAVLADNVRRKEFKHKARQMSSPLVGPLLNAANPFRYLPVFVRLAIRTGLAEKLALRSAQQKLQESQRGLPSAVCRAIAEHVESGRFNMPVVHIKMDHLKSIVALHGVPNKSDSNKALPNGLDADKSLQTLKYTLLVWQKRQFMQLCKRKELGFILEEIIPRLGTPLATLYEELRIGDEIAHLGEILQSVARREEGSLGSLRIRLFAYITSTLRHEGSHKLKENVFWLYERIKEPQIVSLHALLPLLVVVPTEREQREVALWAEVEEARARLAKGEHFSSLTLHLTRQLAPHFHLQLVPATHKSRVQ